MSVYLCTFGIRSHWRYFEYTYKLIPSYPAPMPTWSTPAIFRTWLMCAVTYHENCMYYVIIVMPAAKRILRYTERVTHLPYNEESYIHHPNRELAAISVGECNADDFSTARLITSRVTALSRSAKKITYTYITYSLRCHCCPATRFYFLHTFDV